MDQLGRKPAAEEEKKQPVVNSENQDPNKDAANQPKKPNISVAKPRNASEPPVAAKIEKKKKGLDQVSFIGVGSVRGIQ